MALGKAMMDTNRRSRIGILGGTFNPIHIGHLVLAQNAVETFDLSSVLFIPCAAPPHKTSEQLISGTHRLAMLEQAIGWNPFFEASDLELQRGGVSYAIDTVKALQEQFPQSELLFIIGMDMLLDLHKWKDIKKLLTLCRFVTFGRPGVDTDRLAGLDQTLEPPWPERLLKDVVAGRLLDISSSDIRYRVAEGLSIRYLVPAEVEIYISEHGLYRHASG